MQPETNDIIASIDMHLRDAQRLFGILAQRLQEADDAELPKVRRIHDDRPDTRRDQGDPRHTRPTVRWREEVAGRARQRLADSSAGVADIPRAGDGRARGDLPPAAQHLSEAWPYGQVLIKEGNGAGVRGGLFDFEELAFGRVYVTVELNEPLDSGAAVVRTPARNVEVARDV